MNAIIICLIVITITYCIINQVKIHKLFTEQAKIHRLLYTELEEEVTLIKSRLLDLEQAKAVEDCPHNEILHYHHDGCPACHIFSTEELEAN